MLHGYFDLPTITFFQEKNIWTGSMFTYFNYRITPIIKKGDEENPPFKELFTQIWYGSECYTLAKDNEKFVTEFHEDLTAEGLTATISDLTSAFEEYKKVRRDFKPDYKLH